MIKLTHFRCCRRQGLLALLLIAAYLPWVTEAICQLAHKGPAAAIALSQTVAPYDVSTVKVNKADADSWGMNLSEDAFTATGVPLKFVIAFAYDIKNDLIFGLSGPVDSANFDIMAKILPSGAGPTTHPDRELQAMIIPLLAERFHLKVHLEPKVLPVYDLVVAKGGPKLTLDQSELTGNGWNINGSNDEKVLTANRVTMEDLAAALSDMTDRKVIDKTGLKGHADITLKWSDDVAAELGGPNVISIFTAVQEQLGLKLQPSKGPVDTLVIDHAEMPSEN